MKNIFKFRFIYILAFLLLSAACVPSDPASDAIETARPAATAVAIPTALPTIGQFFGDLTAAGATVLHNGRTEQDLFPAEDIGFWHLIVNDTDINVYEFRDTPAREAVSQNISPRGDEYTYTEGESTVSIIWDGEGVSRWWTLDNLLVHYSGLDTAVIPILNSVLGQPFADGSQPYRPEAGSGSIAGIGEYGVSFQYDPYLAAGLSADITAGRPSTGPDDFIFDVMPDHITFTFLDTYATDWTIYHQTVNIPSQPQILIFPLEAYAGMNQMAQEQITALDSLLRDRPDLPNGPLPHLPPPNGQQDLQAQMAYLTFQNGEGIRYLTQFNQEPRQINNQEIYYTFQGITADHSHTIAAFFPVQSDSLPAEDNITDYEAFAGNMPTYLAQTTADLNRLPTAAFQPDLALLDALIQSLLVEPAVVPEPTLTPPGSISVTLTPLTELLNITETIPVVETSVAYILALQGMEMRSGPGFDYDPVGVVFETQTAQVTGQSQDGQWWRVLCPDSTVGDCWLPADTAFAYPTDAPSLEAMLPDPATLEKASETAVPSPDGRWLATAAWSENVTIINHIIRFYATLTITDGTTNWTPIAEWQHFGSDSAVLPRIIQWSDDGRYLYYTKIRSFAGCYYFINGSNLLRLDVTDGLIAQILPDNTTFNLALSPDSDKVAYISYPDQQMLFMLRTISTGTVQRLILTESADFIQAGEIFWSADGLTAVLTIAHDACLINETINRSIIRINVDTMTATPIIANSDHFLHILDWPDPQQREVRLIDKEGNTWWLDIESGELAAE